MLDKDFLDQNFGMEHKEAFPNRELYKGGWPDMGNGRFTMKADYKAWMEINKGQRVYLNYSENIQQITASMMIAGLFMPLTTAIWGGLYIIFRLGYTCAYLQAPTKRNPWAVFIVLTNILMPLFAMICCVIFSVMVPREGVT